MGSSIHPPITLHLVLTEKLFDALGDAAVDLEQKFSTVVPTRVVRARKGSQQENTLRFEVGSAPEEEAAATDELWYHALATWLSDVFDEVGTTAVREGKTRETNNDLPLEFSWLEAICPGQPPVAVRLSAGSNIPAAAAGYLARAHVLLEEGAFGPSSIAEVRIPSRESYAAQKSAAKRAIQTAPAPDSESDFQADAVKRDQPTRAEIEAAVAEAERALAQAHELARKRESIPFDIDYAVWGVEYADGSVRAFDSVTLEEVER